MPNWVRNNISFYGDENEIERLRSKVRSPDSAFDFNQIVFMPESLNIEDGSSSRIAIACYRAYENNKKSCKEYDENQAAWVKEKTFEEWVQIGKVYADNEKQYGYATWYDWRIANWGTKWPATDPVWKSATKVSFDTAWSPPVRIYDQLAKMFPSVVMEIEYADEDMGCGCGRITYNDQYEGSKTEDFIDTVEFACDVWNYDYNEYMAGCKL